MRLIDKRTVIKSVPRRWREQYRDRRWATVTTKHGLDISADAIYRQLQALDLDTCSEQEVIAIVENSSWTTILCEACEKSVEHAILIDGEGGTTGVLICPRCIGKATKFLQRGMR